MPVRNLRQFSLTACLLSILLLLNVPSVIGQRFLPLGINALAWNADDTLIAALYDDENVKIIDLSGQLVRTIEGEFTTAVTWHPVDPFQILVASYERESNRLIDLRTGIVLTRFEARAYLTYDAAFSPDGPKSPLDFLTSRKVLHR